MPIPSTRQLADLTPQQLRQQFSADEIRQGLAQLEELTSRARPGFTDRLMASFATSPEGEARILRERGFQTQVGPGGRVLSQTDVGGVAVDPEGFDVGDIADLAGEAPSTLLGALGGLGGMVSPVPGGAFAGAGAGSAGGDLLRQKIAQRLGSGEETDLGRVALEGALGVAGEGVGRVLGKAASGLFKRSTEAPDVARTIQQMRDFDTRFGTDLELLAPADVQTGSDFLGNLTQRVRESQFGGQRLREGQDIPFQRELESGFEALRRESGAAGPPGTRGPLAERVGESQAGGELKEAASKTLSKRMQERGQLFDEFRGQIDVTRPPELDQTVRAIEAIEASNIFNRKKTGAQGLDVLRNAVEEANAVKTFDELVTLRQAVQDEIDSFDPARMATGVQAQLKKLRSALRADEEAFLAVGGGMGSEAAQQAGQKARRFAKDLFDVDEFSVQRVFRDDLKLSEIPDNLRRMNADEVRALKQAVGVQGTEGGLKATSEGIAAWQRIAAEVLDDLKQAAKNPQTSTADHFVLSGQRLQTALDRFKPGALEEIFGKETATDLRAFADMARNATVSERNFANFSRTAGANQTIINDLADFFRNPTAAAGRIVGRMFAEGGAGRVLGSQGGKRFLLGTTGFQANNPNVLQLLGRIGGQSAIQGVQGSR